MPAAQPSRLRVGDSVQVIAGAHKGERGNILRFNADHSRVFVEGVNKVRRAVRPVPALNRPGGIVEKEASIHVSNVMLVGPDGALTRIGYRRGDDGVKVRVARKTGKPIG
jgi:large subunit ribosomal protein L24